MDSPLSSHLLWFEHQKNPCGFWLAPLSKHSLECAKAHQTGGWMVMGNFLEQRERGDENITHFGISNSGQQLFVCSLEIEEEGKNRLQHKVLFTNRGGFSKCECLQIDRKLISISAARKRIVNHKLIFEDLAFRISVGIFALLLTAQSCFDFGLARAGKKEGFRQRSPRISMSLISVILQLFFLRASLICSRSPDHERRDW